MRRYDDPVEVRRGMVRGAQGPVEGPEQFLWRGRLWKVADVLARLAHEVFHGEHVSVVLSGKDGSLVPASYGAKGSPPSPFSR